MTPIHMERAEIGIRTVIAFTGALNRHDLPGMLQLVSESCTFEAAAPAPDGAVYRGKTEITQYWQDYLIRTPDVHIKLEESISYGLRCIIRWRTDWTDASGHAAHLRGVDLIRVQNDLIAEHLSYTKG